MADRELLEAFDDCVSRMAAGQSINDCLRRYPQYAAALRPMLEVGKLVERSQAGTFEVSTAQAHIRARVVEHLQAPPRRRRSYTAWVAAAASLLIAAAATFGAAENSLPGDPLYGVKRFEENARSALVGEQFGARRLDEIQVLLALRRSVDVEFTGEIAQIDGTRWVVAGLSLQVGAGPGSEAAQVGDEVRVDGYTTTGGELIAQSVTIVREAIQRSIATATPTATSTLTATSTSTPTDTATLTPTPTFTASSTPTVTPSATFTPSPTATATSTITPTPSPSPSPTATRTPTVVLPTLTLPPTLAPQNPAPTQDDHGGGDDGGDDHGGSSGHGGGDSSGSGGGGDG
ncbi:MAG: hypothetical protein U0521_12120 [Anaerolineae bacterium]